MNKKNFIASLFCIFISNVLLGQVPTILNHSRLSFAVYRGDSIQLTVSAEGNEIQHRWILNDQTLCEENFCDINTNNLTIGTHHIRYIVYNNEGSKYLKFQIKILRRPSGKEVVKISPPIMKAKNIHSIASNDWTASNLKGITYVYGENNSELIVKEPTSLLWNEKLKTKNSSVLKLQKEAEEEQYLFENSIANLATTEEGWRTIFLKQGNLRVRNLKEILPRWTILTASGIQIDLGKSSDVFIYQSKDRKLTTMTSIRGYARIYYIDDINSEGHEVILKPSTSLHFINNKLDLNNYNTNASEISDLIMESTPNIYVFEEYEAKNFEEINNKSQDFKFQGDSAKTLTEAENLIKLGDSYQALSILLPQLDAKSENYLLYYYLGKTSKDLYLYDQAVKFLYKAMLLSPNKPEPHFEYAEMMMSEKNWQEALDSLIDAKNLGYSDKEKLNYYMAISGYYSKNSLLSEKYFTSLKWSANNQDIKNSSLNYLEAIKRDSKFSIDINSNYFSSQNFFHLGTNEILDEKAKTISSSGYNLALKLQSNLFQVWNMLTQFDFYSEYYSFSDINLKDYKFLEMNANLHFNLFWGDDYLYNSFIALEISPLFHSVKVGENSATQGIGVKFSIISWNLSIQPQIYYISSTYQDGEKSNSTFDPNLREMRLGDNSLKHSATGLKIMPYKNEWLYTSVDITGHVYSYIDPNANSKSYTQNDLNFGANLNISNRQQLDLGLGYVTRKFYHSENTDSESEYKQKLDWAWKYTPNLMQKISIYNVSNNTTRVDKSFSNLLIKLGLNLSF